MRAMDPLRWLIAAIATLTVASGVVQMLAPSLVLGLIGGEATAASAHFFGIVGMFMLLFGGALLHGIFSTPPQPVVALWASLQKFGAVAAVSLGVSKRIFSPLALLVAGFDLVSALLIIWYWRRMQNTR